MTKLKKGQLWFDPTDGEIILLLESIERNKSVVWTILSNLIIGETPTEYESIICSTFIPISQYTKKENKK